jgi:ABC-type antimicrobial peptide transport system permease subunit
VKWFDLLASSFRQFRTRPLESGLIVAVIALAVGIETVMLAMVFNKLEQEQALNQSVEARAFVLVASNNDYRSFFSSLGINPVFKVGQASQEPPQFAESDLQAVLNACPALEYAFLADYDGIKEASTSKDSAQNQLVNVLAITQAYIQATRLQLIAGNWPQANDFQKRERVLAISDWFARQRFGRTQPPSLGSAMDQPNNATNSTLQSQAFSPKSVIGQTIRSVNGGDYKIVGVFATPTYVTSREEFQFVHDLQKRGVVGIMPWGINDFAGLSVRELKFVARENQFDQAREQLSAYSRQQYGTSVFVNAARDQILANLSISRNAVLITVLFASCGLVIAALNITNLMLARVLARTRGIGISTALGASPRTIFILFLTESFILAIFGGVIGMLLAFGIKTGLESTLNFVGPVRSNIDLTLSVREYVFGFAVAFGIGLIFGAYPAWTAARVRPSEALRG